MEQEIVDQVKLVLNTWNPLGKNAIKIKDLNDYETEVIDILFFIENEITSTRPVEVKKKIQKIINEIISEAFCINLNAEECSKAAEKIYQIVYKK
jgi:hypothetical protein